MFASSRLDLFVSSWTVLEKIKIYLIKHGRNCLIVSFRWRFTGESMSSGCVTRRYFVKISNRSRCKSVFLPPMVVHRSCKQAVHCTADCFYFSRNSRASSVPRETKHRPCIKDIIEFRWKNPTAIKLSTFVRYFPRTRIFLPRRNCSTLTRWRTVEEREKKEEKETRENRRTFHPLAFLSKETLRPPTPESPFWWFCQSFGTASFEKLGVEYNSMLSSDVTSQVQI